MMLLEGEDGQGEKSAKEVRRSGSGEELRDEVGEAEEDEEGTGEAGRERGVP
jgi:hypothetical protein